MARKSNKNDYAIFSRTPFHIRNDYAIFLRIALQSVACLQKVTSFDFLNISSFPISYSVFPLIYHLAGHVSQSFVRAILRAKKVVNRVCYPRCLIKQIALIQLGVKFELKFDRATFISSICLLRLVRLARRSRQQKLLKLLLMETRSALSQHQILRVYGGSFIFDTYNFLQTFWCQHC